MFCILIALRLILEPSSISIDKFIKVFKFRRCLSSFLYFCWPISKRQLTEIILSTRDSIECLMKWPFVPIVIRPVISKLIWPINIAHLIIVIPSPFFSSCIIFRTKSKFIIELFIRPICINRWPSINNSIFWCVGTNALCIIKIQCIFIDCTNLFVRGKSKICIVNWIRWFIQEELVFKILKFNKCLCLFFEWVCSSQHFPR